MKTGGLVLVPMLVGSATGFGFLGAGWSGIFHAISEEFTFKNWLISTALGFGAGALTGGALGAATAGIAGVGAGYMGLSAGQHIGIGAIAGSVGGACQSVASDFERNIIGGENIGPGKFVKNAVCAVVIGAGVGAAGGAISKSCGGFLASTNVDEVAAAAIFKKAGVEVLQSFSKSGIATGVNAVKTFLEERVDWKSENRHLLDHATDSICGLGKNLVTDGVFTFTTAVLSNTIAEIYDQKKVAKMRFEFETVPDKATQLGSFEAYREYLENPDSNLQGKLRVEKSKTEKCTPYKQRSKYKLPMISKDSDYDSDYES